MASYPRNCFSCGILQNIQVKTQFKNKKGEGMNIPSPAVQHHGYYLL